MALLIGELVGILDLDSKPFDKGLDEVEGKTGKAFGKMKVIAAAAAAAIAATLIKGLGDGMNLDAANDKLAAQLGLTEVESEKAGKIAGGLYADAYGESVAHVNTALAAVSSSLGSIATSSEKDLERWTAKALDVATAFEIDVQRAVSSTGVLLKSGLAKDADHAFDLIVTAMQKVPAHLREDVLDASDEYSQFFSDLGLSGEEAFGMLVRASADGMYGIDKTGDALKELTIRATDMSAASKAAYEAAGLDAGTMAAKIAAGGETARGAFDQIIDGLLGIEDPVAQANAAIGLMGTPLEDLSVSDIPAFLEGLSTMETQLGDVGGAATKMGDTLNDNAKTKVEAFKRDALMKLTNFMADSVIPAFESMGKFVSENTELVMPLAIVIGGALVAAFIAWAAAAATAAAATIAATWPILAIGAAIAVLIAGAWLLIDNWDAIFQKFKDITGTSVGWVIDQFKKIPGWITSALSGVADLITAPYRIGFNAIARLWNNTVGKLSFSIPSWVPGLGGKGWDVPDIPTFHQGGVFRAPTPGGEGMALLEDEEMVLTKAQQRALGSGGSGGGGYGTATIVVELDGEVLARKIGQPLVDTVRARTGVI